MEIKEDFRIAAETGFPTRQPTSKNHNYFYPNPNQVIQKLKSLPKKSSFWEKYQKNTNTDRMNPENQNREHAQITKNCWSNLQALTLKNHHLINKIDFNEIPNGKVSYNSLV